jgi:hypothetical protein
MYELIPDWLKTLNNVNVSVFQEEESDSELAMAFD